MTETLKPCPFCGGEAEIRGDDAPENWVSCKENCQPSGRDKERLVRAWNTRAPRQSMSDEDLITELLRRHDSEYGQHHVWDGADSHFEGRIVGLAIKLPWKEGAAGGEVRVIAQQEGTGILLIKGLPK